MNTIFNTGRKCIKHPWSARVNLFIQPCFMPSITALCSKYGHQNDCLRAIVFVHVRQLRSFMIDDSTHHKEPIISSGMVETSIYTAQFMQEC